MKLLTDTFNRIEEERKESGLKMVESYTPKGFPLAVVLTTSYLSREDPEASFLEQALINNDALIFQRPEIKADDDLIIDLVFSRVPEIIESSRADLAKKTKSAVITSIKDLKEAIPMFHLRTGETGYDITRDEYCPFFTYTVKTPDNTTFYQELKKEKIPFWALE